MKIRHKKSGNTYIVWWSGLSSPESLYYAQNTTLYYARIEKNGKAFGATRVFTEDKIEVLSS